MWSRTVSPDLIAKPSFSAAGCSRHRSEEAVTDGKDVQVGANSGGYNGRFQDGPGYFFCASGQDSRGEGVVEFVDE